MIAIVLALVAAALNATASVCQRRAGQDEPDQHGSTLRMMFDLVRRPVWIAGIVAMVTGFGLEAVALTLGRLALIEPLMIAELPLTLLGATWAFHRRLSGRAWAALVGLAVGLALFVVGLSPEGGDPGAVPLWKWLVAVGVTVGAAVAAMLAGWWHRRPRAAWWGIGTGVTFGLMSALISGAGAAFSEGGVGLLFTSWQTYAAVVVGPTSFFLLQNALQAGTLVASQPGFTLMNPVVSVVWGVFVFGEQTRTGLWFVLTGVGALGVVAATLLMLRASHEQDDQADGGDDGERTDGERTDGERTDGERTDAGRDDGASSSRADGARRGARRAFGGRARPPSRWSPRSAHPS